MTPAINALEKIYIPLNDNDVHWFLLVVCLNKEKLLYLDSKLSISAQEDRHGLVIEMASYP